MNRGLELEGQRFGHLTVLKRLDERENRYIMWLCRCDCGNEIKVNTRRLVRGTVDNCGCILEKTARRGPVAEDLTGQRFGKLVAVRRIRSQNGRTRWECRCDCGNIHIVTAHALKAGKCTSCGCSRYEKGRGVTDISGQKFGRLTALYHTDKRSKKGNGEGDLLNACVEMLEKRKHRSDNTSGFRGIYHMNNGKYRATIGFKGKRFYIGTFKNYEDAVQARLEAENTIHGGFVQAWYTWNSLAEKDPKWAEEHPLVYEIERVNGEFQVITNMNRQMELPVHK